MHVSTIRNIFALPAGAGAVAAAATGPEVEPDSWRTLEQGQVGDCYFLAPLDGLARQHPEAVSGLIHPSAASTWRVTFYGRRAVTVAGDEVRHGVSADGPWARILECAWQKSCGHVRGGKVHEKGGDPACAIEALTGHAAASAVVGPRTADLVIARMKASLDVGGIAVASTRERPEKGLFPDHAYTVLAIDERGNVLLRNPWGDHPYTGPEPAGYQIEGEGPGTFAVSSQTFARNFPDVCWEKMKATA